MKRIIISLIVAFVIGTTFGASGTYALMKNKSSSKYGDSKNIDEEIDINWSNADMMQFKPIDIDLDENIQEFIYLLCDAYNIDYSFVLALIDQESSFTVNAVSDNSDYGLFQINEVNHEELKNALGITDINDPYENTRAGMFILRKLFEKYEEPTKVLMAYNMGETGAKALWDKNVFSTNYTKKILNLQKEYEKRLLKND